MNTKSLREIVYQEIKHLYSHQDCGRECGDKPFEDIDVDETLTAILTAVKSKIPKKESDPHSYKLCSQCGNIHCGGYERNSTIEKFERNIE